MSIEVKVPVLPESVSDALIATWHKKAGDAVKRDENLLDLETDKVVLEVPSPVDGVLKEIKFEEGSTVTSSQVIAVIEEGAAAAAPAPAPAAAAAEAPEAAEAEELVPLEEADAEENTGKVKAVVPESEDDIEIDETIEDDDDDDSTFIADEEEGDEDVTDIIGDVGGDEET